MRPEMSMRRRPQHEPSSRTAETRRRLSKQERRRPQKFTWHKPERSVATIARLPRAAPLLPAGRRPRRRAVPSATPWSRCLRRPALRQAQQFGSTVGRIHQTAIQAASRERLLLRFGLGAHRATRSRPSPVQMRDCTLLETTMPIFGTLSFMMSPPTTPMSTGSISMTEESNLIQTRMTSSLHATSSSGTSRYEIRARTGVVSTTV